MSSYINELISRIYDKRSKKAIELELNDHFLELVDYYMDIGYDKERAEQLANERLGDSPKLVGDQLSVINKSIPAIILKIVFGLASVGVSLVLLLMFILGYQIFFAISAVICFGMIAFFVNLLLALKLKSNWFSFFAFVIFMNLSIANFATGSQFTATVFEMLKGNIKDFSTIAINYYAYVTSDAFYITTIAMLIVLLLVNLAVIFNVSRFHSLSTKRIDAVFQLMVRRAFVAIIILILAFYSYGLITYYSINREDPYLDRIVVYESDSPLEESELKELCKPNEYNDDDANEAYIHFEMFTDIPDLHTWGNFYCDDDADKAIRTIEHKYDSIVGYRTYNAYLSYRLVKNYAYIIPQYYEADTDLSKVKCVEKGKKEHITISYLDDYYVYDIAVQ